MTTAERRPFAFVLAAGYTIALVLTMGLALAITQAIRPGAESDLVTLTACHALAHFAVLFVAMRIHEPETELREVMGLRTVGIVPAIASLALGAGIYPALARVDAAFAERFPQDPHDTEIMNALTATPTIASRVVLIAALALAMPFAEEVFFRGFVFGSLRRGRSASLAAAATTAFFVLSRFDPRAMGSLVALGIALSFVRTRAGSSLASTFTHAAFYLVPLAPLVRGGAVIDDDAFTRNQVIAGLAVAAVGVLALQLTSTRAASSRAALARDAE